MALTAGALAAALGGCGISLQRLPQLGGSTGGYPITAEFASVASLAPNAQVRQGDAIVGHVTSITARDFHAEVVMHLDKGTVLPRGTTASVMFSTPLGDEYVSLVVPPAGKGGAPLPPGAVLSEAQTSAAPTVADTLAALATVLYGSGLGQAETITSELNSILGGRGPEIQHLLADIDTTVTSFANADPALDAALSSVQGLSAQLASGTDQIVAALDTLPQAAATLTADNAAFQQLLSGVEQLGPAVEQLVASTGRQLVADSQALAPVAAQLATLQATIGGDLADLGRALTDAGKTAPNGYLQGYFSLNAFFPDVACGINTPANPTPPCSSTEPQANMAPDQGLPPSPSEQQASSPGSGSASGSSASAAVAEMTRALP